MNPNIIAAIVNYLQAALVTALQVSPTNLGVWAYYARSTLPGVSYAVVQRGPEFYTYSQAGGDEFVDGSGSGELVQAEGDVNVIFIAPTVELVEELADLCVLVCNDSVAGDLQCANGRTTYMRPARADSEAMSDTGPGVPATFRRQVQIHYKRDFYLPSGIAPTQVGGS
jgi:hypothetical protein